MKRSNVFPGFAAVTVLLWLAHDHSWAALIGLIGLAAYVIDLVVNPWVPCSGCNATGRQWSQISNSFRTCNACGGLTVRVLLGRRLWAGGTNINESRK